MTKKAVTIRDVARHAGVSVATASRALNGMDVVNPQTRDRILAVMEELGFTPSPAARRLSLGRTLTIGVVVSFLTRPQAAERLRGVDAVLTDSEFDLVIYNVESVQKRDHYLGTLAQSQRTDGLLVMSLPPPDAAVPQLGRGRPSRSCSSTSIRRRSRRCRGSSATTPPVAPWRPDTSSTSATRRSGSSATRSRDPFGFTSSRDRQDGPDATSWPAPGISIPDAWIGHGAHGRYEARDLARRMLAGPIDRRPSSPRATRRRWASSPRPARSASTSPTTCRSSATTTSRPPTTSG